MDILLALSLSFFVLLIIKCFTSVWTQKTRARFLPPGPAPFPLLGNPKYVDTETGWTHYRELWKKYGPIFTIWKLTEPVVVLCGYEVVKDALVNHGATICARPVLPMEELEHEGFSIASGNGMWRELRRGTLTSLRNLGMGKKSMEDLVLKEVKPLLEAVSETGGKAFNTYKVLGCAICNVRCSMLFGKTYKYHDQELLDVLNNVRTHVNIFSSSFTQVCNTFPSLAYIPAVRRKLTDGKLFLDTYIQNQIDLHKKTLDKSSPRDFIDTFLLKIKEEGSSSSAYLSETGLKVTILNILAGGTDTTRSSLNFYLVVMAHFPHIQAKVQEEIDDVIGSMRPPSNIDKAQMPFTNAVIHESQRLLELAPVGMGHAPTEDTVFRGYIIPKGTAVIPCFSSVLSDPSQWETPDEFNPGHFLDEDGQFRPRPAFMAFSTGKRVCLGENLARMDLFLLFSSLLQKFTFKRAPGTQPETGKALRDNKWTHILFAELCAVPRTSSS